MTYVEVTERVYDKMAELGLDKESSLFDDVLMSMVNLAKNPTYKGMDPVEIIASLERENDIRSNTPYDTRETWLISLELMEYFRVCCEAKTPTQCMAELIEVATHEN